jgi:hypothetical protein
VDPTLLEEFKTYSGLLEFHLGLVLQTVTLAMTVTSAVVAYLVKSDGTLKSRAWALLLPALLCGGLGIGFVCQRGAAQELQDRLVELARELHFGLAPHAGILVNAVTWLGVMLIVTGLALVGAAIFSFWGDLSRIARLLKSKFRAWARIA